MLLQKIFDGSPDGILVVDRHLKCVAWNRVMHALTGVPAEDIVGHHIVDRCPVLSTQGEDFYLRKALAGQQVLAGARPYQAQGSELVSYFESCYAPVRDNEGDVEAVIITVREVSAKIKRFSDLKSAADALTTALTSDEVAKTIVGKAIEATNAEAGVLSLMHPDGQNLEIIYMEGFPPHLIAQYRILSLSLEMPMCIAARTRASFVVEDLRQHADEYPDLNRVMEATGRCSYLALPLLVDNQVIGAFALGFSEPQRFAHDERFFLKALAGQCAQAIERTRMIDLEKKARAQAEDANLAKSRFLANVSHEVRTPLTAIIGFTELLKRQGDPQARTATHVDGIARNSLSLLKIVDDVLDFSAIEAGRYRTVQEPVIVDELISEVLSVAGQLVGEKPLKLAYEKEGELPDCFISDFNRIKQILLNIVGNSIKFTHDGVVTIKVSFGVNRDPATGRHLDGRPVLKFVVQDTGIGISESDKRFLFQPFSRVQWTDRKKYGGSGLGLAIGKRLAQALGGDIRLIRSSQGEGSEFALSIPCQLDFEDSVLAQGVQSEHSYQAVYDGQDVFTASKLIGKSILLVEDHEDVRAFLADAIEWAGARVVSASNGFEALSLIADDRFDLVLMDLEMPVMNGYVASERMRASGFVKPILALSAHVLEEHAVRTKNAGFDEHIAKPVQIPKLLQILERHLAVQSHVPLKQAEIEL